MTAAEYLSEAADLALDVAQAESATAQVKLRAAVFDYDAPLPDLRIRAARSWEPAARRYRDLTIDEKEMNA